MNDTTTSIIEVETYLCSIPMWALVLAYRAVPVRLFPSL